MRILCAIPFLLAAASGATAGDLPSLRVVSKSPLVVAGASFRPAESISVTAMTGLGPRTTRVVATDGRFRVAFKTPAQGCGAAFAVRATGSRGSRATITVGRVSVCVPPPQR